MPSTHLNVFLRPPLLLEAELHRTALNLSAPFLHRGLIPHITLFLFRTNRPAEVVPRVGPLLEKQAAVPITLAPLRQAGTWLFLDVEKSAALSALNAQVANLLGPLRDPQAEVPSFIATVPDEKVRADLMASFTAYGYPRVGALYKPHCSLSASVAPGFTPARPTATGPAGLATEAGVGIANDDGQVFEVLTTFTLHTGTGA